MNPLNPIFSLLVSRGIDPKEYSSKFSASQPKIVDESAVGSKDFQTLLQIRDALAAQHPNIDKYFIFNASNPVKIKPEANSPYIDEDGIEWAVADEEDEDLAVPVKAVSEHEEIDELEWAAAEEEDEPPVGIKAVESGAADIKSDEDVKRTIQRLKNEALAKLHHLEQASTEGLSRQNSVLIAQIRQDIFSIVHELLEYTQGMAAHEDVISMKISMEHYFEKVLQSRGLDEGIKPLEKNADAIAREEALPVVQNGLGQSIQPKKRFWEVLEVTSSIAKGTFEKIQNAFASIRIKAGEAYNAFIGKNKYGPLTQKEALDHTIQQIANQVASSIAANLRHTYFSGLPNFLAAGLQRIVEFVLSSKQFLPYLLTNVVSSTHANLIADPERAKEILDRLINNQIAILDDGLKTIHAITESVEAANPGLPKSQLEGFYLRALRDSGKLTPDFEPSLTPKEIELRELELSGAPIPAVDQESAEIVRRKCQAHEHLFFREMAKRLYDQLLLPNGLSPQLEFFQKLAGTDFKELSIEQIAALIERQVNAYSDFKTICPLLTSMLRQASKSVKRPDVVTEFSQKIGRFLADVEALPEKMKQEELVDVRRVGLKFEETDEVAVDLSFKPEADVGQLILSVTHIALKGAPTVLLAGVQAASSSILQKVQRAPAVQKIVSFTAERRYDRAIAEKVGGVASPIIQKVTESRAFQGVKNFFKAKFETYRVAEKSKAAFQSVMKKASAVADFAQTKAENGLARKIQAKVVPSIQRARDQVLERLNRSGEQVLEENLNWMAASIDVMLRPKIAVQPVAPAPELSEEEMKADFNEALAEALVKFRLVSEDDDPEVISQMIENVAKFAANNIVNQLSSRTLNRHLMISFLDGFLGAFSKA